MRPFEEIMGGKSTKRIWTRKDELDVTVRSDRQKIWDALNYAAVEREMIAFRTGEGRDILRESETAKIDKLPFYVKFTPVDAKVNEGKFSWIPEYRARMSFSASSNGRTRLPLGYQSPKTARAGRQSGNAR